MIKRALSKVRHHDSDKARHLDGDKARHGNGDKVRHASGESQPRLHQHSPEVQRFDQLVDMPIGLSANVRAEMAQRLNRVLADTRVLYDLYKKTHWLMRGHTFYQ